MPLSGSEKEELGKAMLSSFDRDDLAQLTLFKLSKNLDHIIKTPASDEDAVRQLIEWAENTGQTKDLVQSVRDARLDRPDIQELAHRLLSSNPTEATVADDSVPDHSPVAPGSGSVLAPRWMRAAIVLVVCFGLVVLAFVLRPSQTNAPSPPTSSQPPTPKSKPLEKLRLETNQFISELCKDQDHQHRIAMEECQRDKRFFEWFDLVKRQHEAFKENGSTREYIRLTEALTKYSMDLVSTHSREFPILQEKYKAHDSPDGEALQGWVRTLLDTNVEVVWEGRPPHVPDQDWPREMTAQRWLVFIGYFESGQEPPTLDLVVLLYAALSKQNRADFEKGEPEAIKKVERAKNKFGDLAKHAMNEQRDFFNRLVREHYAKWYQGDGYSHKLAIDAIKHEIKEKVKKLKVRAD